MTDRMLADLRRRSEELTDSVIGRWWSPSDRYLMTWWIGLATAFLMSAGTGFPAAGQVIGEAKPDFLVRDVNPNSPRNGKAVSPRDYRLQISAFYFGAAG